MIDTLEPAPRPGDIRPAVSGLVVVGGIVALAMIALAAIVMVADNDGATGRLALLFAILTPTVAALVGAVRADQAASRLNGGLDARIRRAVLESHASRRESDPVTNGPPPTVTIGGERADALEP